MYYKKDKKGWGVYMDDWWINLCSYMYHDSKIINYHRFKLRMCGIYIHNVVLNMCVCMCMCFIIIHIVRHNYLKKKEM